MRWPFRRKAADSTAAAPVERDSPQGSVAAPVGEASVPRAPARQWATLPAIPTTIPRTVPLVVGPAPVVPPLRLGDRRGTASVEPAVGTVTGLARPVVRTVDPDAPDTPHADVTPPPIVRRPVRSEPAEVAPLVDAVDEYVGEPRVPAEPYKAPGWLRFMPDWAKALQGQQPAIPGLPTTPDLPAPSAPSPNLVTPAPLTPDMVVAEPPSFLPPELRNPQTSEPPHPSASDLPQAPELPPRMTESVRPSTEALSPLMRRRRPNLGQSRRLGLGAPITKPDLIHPEESPPFVDGTVESPQEPPPPPAAPAHVAPEPAPQAPILEPQTPDLASQAPVLEPQAPILEPEPAFPETQAAPIHPSPPMIHPSPPIGALSPSIGASSPPNREAHASISGQSPSDTGASPPNIGGTSPNDGPTPSAKPVAAVYRATAELRPAPRRERPRATVVDRVPAPLANEVRARQQADVADVAVYRGPKVGEAAKSRGARAFAAGGAVFLPDEAGPVDSPRARGLLAHELVHAVQQRTLGSRLPAPDSPLGQRLEAEAQAAERYYAGESGAAEPAPLIHAPLPAPAAAHAEPDMTAAAQLATELAPVPSPTPETTPQNLQSPFDPATTEEVGKIATESAKHVVMEWTNPALHPGGTTGRSRSGGTRSAQAGRAAAFNAAARHEQLVAATLAVRNQNLAFGEPEITELSQEELTAIDDQIDMEAEGRGARGSRRGSRQSTQNQTQEQRYEPNSAKAWMHAVTGMNMNYGFGLSGYDKVPVGSDNSWFESETEDKRPLRERLADQMGLTNADTKTQFDTDTWWQPEEEEDGTGITNDGRQSISELFDNAQLDELATRLYDRLRSRLRTELLVDRERAGLLTDFR
jgi:hypothetical protein